MGCLTSSPHRVVRVGYLFTYPMKAGLESDTKILWYVATPRRAMPLEAEGHPLGATSPTAKFSKAADSFPGEIYPTGPTVPSAGCWHFTLTWRGGEHRVEVDSSSPRTPPILVPISRICGAG